MNLAAWIFFGLWVATVLVVAAYQIHRGKINGRLVRDMLSGSIASLIRNLLKHIDAGNKVDADIRNLCNEITYYIALGGTVMALNWCVDVTTRDMKGLKHPAKVISFDWYIAGEEISITIGENGIGFTFTFEVERANSLILLNPGNKE